MDTYNTKGWVECNPVQSLISNQISWIKEKTYLKKGPNHICLQEFKAEKYTLNYLIADLKEQCTLEYSGFISPAHLYMLLSGEMAVLDISNNRFRPLNEKTFTLLCLEKGRYGLRIKEGLTILLYISIEERYRDQLNDFDHIHSWMNEEKHPLAFFPSMWLSNDLNKILNHLFILDKTDYDSINNRLNKCTYVLLARYDIELYYYTLRPDTDCKYREMVEWICDEIQEAPELSLTDRFFAKKYKLSINTLARYFKKHTGFTIAAYRQKQLMRHAEILILEGKKIKEIAGELGYTEVTGFCTAFKAHSGHKPLIFRRLVTERRAERSLVQPINVQAG